MARLYSNENFPLPVVEELRRLGHDVLTMYDSGTSDLGVPDVEVLKIAVRDNRALLTLNRRHFIALHQEAADHCGIVVCTVDPDFLGQAQRIDQAIGSEPDLSGKLIRVNRPQ